MAFTGWLPRGATFFLLTAWVWYIVALSLDDWTYCNVNAGAAPFVIFRAAPYRQCIWKLGVTAPPPETRNPFPIANGTFECGRFKASDPIWPNPVIADQPYTTCRATAVLALLFTSVGLFIHGVGSFNERYNQGKKITVSAIFITLAAMWGLIAMAVWADQLDGRLYQLAQDVGHVYRYYEPRCENGTSFILLICAWPCNVFAAMCAFSIGRFK
jgi:hypothetical protein